MSVSFAESLSSLKFAKRAKSIKNKAVVNQDERHQAMLSVYEREIGRLKLELASTREGLIEKEELERLALEKKKVEQEKVIISLHCQLGLWLQEMVMTLSYLLKSGCGSE
jgi:hypothetical protein